MTPSPLKSPDPGFDVPTELLEACHEKVRQFTQLALRLADHVQERGIDADVMEAATRILRYFRVAAPLHHQDEELDLFPALIALTSPPLEAQASGQLHADIAILESEHQILDEIWHQVEPWLESVENGHKVVTPQRLGEFVAIYEGHMQREQNKVFPYASRLTATQRKQICLQMARRRGLKT